MSGISVAAATIDAVADYLLLLLLLRWLYLAWFLCYYQLRLNCLQCFHHYSRCTDFEMVIVTTAIAAVTAAMTIPAEAHPLLLFLLLVAIPAAAAASCG